MKIDFHRTFNKQYKKISPKQKQHFKARLALFARDQTNILLNNHTLKGKYKGYRSINIEGDLRAIFYQHVKNHVEFVAIGSHSQLYD